MILRLFALVLAALLPPLSALGQSVLAGFEAAEQGDYALALSNWQPLAKDGDAEAQYQLGLMNLRGIEPVSQDTEEALYWLNLSAKQRFGPALATLGSVYHLGQGVPQDYVTAHMWKNLASAVEWRSQYVSDDKLAEFKAGQRLALRRIEHLLTPDGILEAQRRARLCLSTSFKNCD